MNSKIYLRKISYNYFLLLLTFRPLFFRKFFFCFVRTGYSSHNISDNSSSLDLSKTLEPRWLTSAESNSLSVTIRVIVKEVLLNALRQIQRRQWWQKLNLFISYESNFRCHFVYLSFARRPRKECACVSHKIAQFMLKIANKPFAWWRHFTTMTRIVQGFAFLCKLGLLLFKLHCGYQI